jgi:hypothetical protein
MYYCKKYNRILTSLELKQHPCFKPKLKGKNKGKCWCNNLLKI